MWNAPLFHFVLSLSDSVYFTERGTFRSIN